MQIRHLKCISIIQTLVVKCQRLGLPAHIEVSYIKIAIKFAAQTLTKMGDKIGLVHICKLLRHSNE